MINRNALLIIIITLTCAFLAEKEVGETDFFLSLSFILSLSLPPFVCVSAEPEKSVGESEENFVCNSPPLMVAPCRGASKQSRNTSTPTSPLRWEMVSLRTEDERFLFTHREKFNTLSSTRRLLKTKLSGGGLPFEQCCLSHFDLLRYD